MHATMVPYEPWIYHQQMLEQNPYYQYAISDLQAYYSSSEHHEEDTDHTGDELPSETSSNQSPNPDMFRLAFAASQWSKLVLNAEGLFNQLMTTTPAEQNLLKNQIEQWLCMKQEYEECIAVDDSGSLPGFTENTRKSLERIEEVTETEEKTDESNNWDEDQSETESENPDFLDKLDEYMKKFKRETDEIIKSKTNDCFKSEDVLPVLEPVVDSDFVPIVKPLPIRNPTSRRKSILPHSEMSSELVEFQKQNSNVNLGQQDIHIASPLEYPNYPGNDKSQEKLNKSREGNTSKAIVQTQSASVDPEHANIIKLLMINNEEKQSQLKKIQFDLNFVYKQVEELKNTIKLKEQFIDDMLKSCDARNSAKEKFQKKRDVLEEKYRNTQELLNYKRILRDSEDDPSYNEEIEKYENLLTYYEKKLKDTKIIKQVAGDSAKTIVYLKNSLSTSKKQMEKLVQRVRDEEENKKSLENDLTSIQRKIQEFEEPRNCGTVKLKEMRSESEDDRNHFKSQMKSEDRNKSLVQANERISRLDDLLKEKLNLNKIDDPDDHDTLRQEIGNLRRIRDRLIDEKCEYTSEGIPTSVEEQRQVLLISECVETIDAMIEQKNVMICGEEDYNERKCNRFDEQIPIMNRLEKLSHDELVTLFFKYFYKVIDLKDSSKNLEIQNTALEESFKKLEIENDQRMIMLHKAYERKISLLLNYYAEETNSSGYSNRTNRNGDFEQLMKENQALRRRLAHFDSLLKASGTTQAVQSNTVRMTNQALKPKSMQLALPPKTTKVTRQGNKLIILTGKK